MDDYSYLHPRLAQGSAPPPGMRVPFDIVVLCAEEYQPDLPGYHVIHLPLDDGPPPDKATRMRIRRTAREVADRVRLGERALVTCYAGRNRSGVVAGLALVELGVPPREAIRRIQRARNGLGNEWFRAMVARAPTAAG